MGGIKTFMAEARLGKISISSRRWARNHLEKKDGIILTKDDGILQFQGPSKQDSQSLDCYFEIVYQPTHVVGLHLNAWAFWPTTDSLSCGGEQQLWHELCDEAPHLFSPSTNLILWSRLHSSLYDLHGIASQMVVTHKSDRKELNRINRTETILSYTAVKS